MKNKPARMSAPTTLIRENQALHEEIRRLRRDRWVLQSGLDTLASQHEALKDKHESLDAELERQAAYADEVTRQRDLFRRWMGRYEKIFWTGFAVGEPPTAWVVFTEPILTPHWWVAAEHALILLIGAGYFGFPRLRRIWNSGDPAADIASPALEPRQRKGNR